MNCTQDHNVELERIDHQACAGATPLNHVDSLIKIINLKRLFYQSITIFYYTIEIRFIQNV